MASLQILKSNLSPFSSVSHSNFRRKSIKSNWSCSRLTSQVTGRRIFGSKIFVDRKRFRISSKQEESDNSQGNGEEPPESLFMKELKRRGMTPTSLLEESNRDIYIDEDVKLKEDEGDFSGKNAVSMDAGNNFSNQREQSMALNSEGLEGLIPRAKLLLALGGTFFLAFGPLILVTITFFFALYLYFGATFIHDGSSRPVVPPEYVDPYTLLEDIRISQTPPPRPPTSLN